MLDSEVQLQWVVHYQKSRFDPGCLGYGIAILGGTIGGVLLGREVLELGKLLTSTTAIAGAVAAPETISRIEDALNNRRKKKYLAELAQAEEKAQAEGAPRITISYRGHRANMIVLPEHQSGHIYELETNDGFIKNCRFAYQPNRLESLEFGFTVPQFPHVSTPHTLLETHLAQSQGLPAKAAQEYIAATGKAAEAGGFRTAHTHDKNGVHTELSYTGEDYRGKLPSFTRTASNLLQLAYEHRSKQPAHSIF